MSCGALLRVCGCVSWRSGCGHPDGDPRRDVACSVVRRRLVRRMDWWTVAWRLLRKLVPDDVGRDGWVLGECPWSV